jgi:hypothetical protein
VTAVAGGKVDAGLGRALLPALEPSRVVAPPLPPVAEAGGR